ncbi:MAG TPA: PAS domain S-box protein, partial [Archangium sp.]
MAADDAFYRRFFEVLPDAAFVVDPRIDRFLDVSDASVVLYGRTKEELLTVPAVSLSAEPEATRAALDAAAASVHQRLHRRADGTTFLVEASTQRLEWDGRVLVVGVTRDVSAEQRFEAELSERRALIDAAFHKSPLLLSLSVFPERRHVLVNETFCEVSGFSREELIGHSSVELGIVDPVEVKPLEAVLRESGGLNGVEFVIHSRTRGVVNVRLWSKVIDTREGPRLFTAAEDLTARKEAEAAREFLHRRLLRIADRLPGVIFQFRMRPDGSVGFPFASRAQKDLYGVEPADVKEDGRPAFAAVHPDDLPAVFESIQRSARDLSPWRLEHRVRGADGRWRWLEGNAMPEREADGSILWNGFIEDVSARKANEAALRQSDERFHLAMEATRDALWERDLVTGHLSISPHFARSLGYEPDAFAGGTHYVHPDDLPRVEAASRPCIEGRAERFEVEYRVRASDGSWRWFLTRGKCIARDAGGRATRLLGTNADITERKASQLSLAQTERLASTGLIAGGMAHEINNPLASVHANLDALAAELPNVATAALKALAALKARGGEVALVRALELELSHFDELLTATNEALDGARRIRKISHGLGTFARPERPERTPVDVNEAIESAATMAHREVTARAQLVKDLGPLPPVRGSEG